LVPAVWANEAETMVIRNDFALKWITHCLPSVREFDDNQRTTNAVIADSR
jgi:hypothetical protein